MVASSLQSLHVKETPSPSYSGWKHQKLRLGIDTLTLRAPVLDYDWTHQRLHREVDRNGEIKESPVGTNYRIRDHVWATLDHRAGEPRIRVEVSIPRFARGSNVIPATITEMREAVGFIYDDLAESVDWAVPAEEMVLNRLDLDSDVYLDPALGVRLPALLDALARHPGHRAGSSRRLRDPLLGRAESLMRGNPDSWSVVVYDKHTDALHQARRARSEPLGRFLDSQARLAQGVVRSELRLRRPALKDCGIRTVSDLREENLMEVFDRYVERVGLDSDIQAPAAAQAILAERARDPATARHVQSVIGRLFLDYHGLPGGSSSPNTVAKDRRLADAWGLTPSGLFGPSLPTTVRFDFESGTICQVQGHG